VLPLLIGRDKSVFYLEIIAVEVSGFCDFSNYVYSNFFEGVNEMEVIIQSESFGHYKNSDPIRLELNSNILTKISSSPKREITYPSILVCRCPFKMF